MYCTAFTDELNTILCIDCNGLHRHREIKIDRQKILVIFTCKGGWTNDDNSNNNNNDEPCNTASIESRLLLLMAQQNVTVMAKNCDSDLCAVCIWPVTYAYMKTIYLRIASTYLNGFINTIVYRNSKRFPDQIQF